MVIQAKKKHTHRHSGLGRGLDSLIATTHLDSQKNDILHIDVASLRAGIGQPRKNFNATSLNELAESIRQKGLLQPLLIRDINGTNAYEIVAGERRYRAAKIAGLQTVPCIVMQIDDVTAHEVALIENIQREDLDPLEEAFGYKTIMENFHYTQQQMAQIIGKSRSRIANTLRLLQLPEEVQQHIRNGTLTSGHAKVLVGVKNATTIAKKIISENMSVRQTEQYIKDLKNPTKPSKNTNDTSDSLQQTQQQLLSQLYNRPVNIKINAKGAGKITLPFDNKHDMEQLLNALANMRGE